MNTQLSIWRTRFLSCVFNRSLYFIVVTCTLLSTCRFWFDSLCWWIACWSMSWLACGWLWPNVLLSSLPLYFFSLPPLLLTSIHCCSNLLSPCSSDLQHHIHMSTNAFVQHLPFFSRPALFIPLQPLPFQTANHRSFPSPRPPPKPWRVSWSVCVCYH